MKMALSCYYKFNEGSGSTLIDDGPNGINGNINGAVWSTDVPEMPMNQKLKEITLSRKILRKLILLFQIMVEIILMG